MKFECIKGMATSDNVSVVVMQGDWVELVSTDEGEVLVNGVAGWCNGFELTLGQILTIAIVLILGVIFWQVSGQNLGASCPVG